MTRWMLIAGLTLLVGTAAPVLAQTHPQTRQGFWIGFGLGIGSAGISCNGCTSGRESGLSGYLRMGGTVSPQLLIGGETNGWTKSSDGVDQTVGFLSAVAYYYPVVDNGVWIKGGLGFASYEAEAPGEKLTTSGLGLTAGIGFDWRLSANVSLSPFANYMQQVGGDVEYNGESVGNANANLIQFGVGLSWH
ncbi:MAG TPA: outer membrane beta-barrel protein [Gemmatimonadaceae bacterium]|nr:outer membrane beta-barrel protein [Gemmatimonadaceae bacterium]